LSVSIYYKFDSKYDLEKSGVFKMVEDQWNEAFDNNPYESWTWYEPKSNKRFLRAPVYSYEGATKFPPDNKQGAKAFRVSLGILSSLRKKLGGDNWVVHLDDQPIAWDSNVGAYVP
jgi:hypothetical protein